MDSTLVNKINFSLNLLKQTSFYRKMVDILEKNEFKAQIQRVKSMQENGGIEMVIYEIGSMENREESQMQLALALLLKNELQLVQDVTIYDQNLSATELKVINHFQCQCYSITTINKVERPTLFFISGCKFYLWNSILEANKMPQELNRIVILGNPLKQWVPILPRNFGEIKYPLGIMENNRDKIKEFPIWLSKGENFDLGMPQWWSFHFGSAAIDLHQIALRHVCYNISWHFFDGFVDPVKVPSDEEHINHFMKSMMRKVQSSNPPTHNDKKVQSSNPPTLHIEKNNVLSSNSTLHIEKKVSNSNLTPRIHKKVLRSNPTPNIDRFPCSSSALDLADPTADEIRIRESIEASMRRLEVSDFYKKFRETIKSPKFVQLFERLKLTQQQLTGNLENFTLPIVLYGVGKIEESENSRLQFSLAILLKRDFEWVEDLTAFEPLANPTEIKVMQGFGCNWISNNEKGRRFVHKPTLFFMPGVPLYVHNNLYSANWGSAGLNKMIVLGNSFKTTTSFVPQMTYIFQVLHRDGVVCEVPVSGQESVPPDDCSFAFQFYSWHFFNSSSNSYDQKISVPNLVH